MKLERSKNSIRNMFWGFSNKLINMILPFILRSVIIYSLGDQYLGLNSLFTSILTVLNLAELGFSNAVVFAMYKPIADNDTDKICALMAYYKKIYRIIGCVVAGIGLIIMPFIPTFIKGSYPHDINIYILYLMFLLNTSISYFMYAYKTGILSAYQREDIISRVEMLLHGFIYIIQIFILLVFRNYYLYIVLNISYTILNNIVCAYYASKKYPQYRCHGELDKAEKSNMKKNIGGLMIGKVCMVSRNSLDNIFISLFLGLSTVAIYGNYYYIMSAVISILAIIMSSVSAGVGNSVASESSEKNYKDMSKLSFIYAWIASWCTVCLFCLYQPFMRIWMGENRMFPMADVLLFCLYFYALSMGDVRSRYSNAAGLFWESRNYVIFETIMNIALNYILGRLFGVHGIIFATLITILLVNFGWGSRIIFKYYFKTNSVKEYFGRHFYYFVTMLIACIITYAATMFIKNVGVFGLFLKAAICVVLPNIIFYLIYKKYTLFNEAKSMFLNLIAAYKRSY